MMLYQPINSQNKAAQGCLNFFVFVLFSSSRLGWLNVVEIKVVCISQIQLVVMCISPQIHLVAKCVFLISSWSVSVCSSTPSDPQEYFFFHALHQSVLCVCFFYDAKWAAFI